MGTAGMGYYGQSSENRRMHRGTLGQLGLIGAQIMLRKESGVVGKAGEEFMGLRGLRSG